MFSHSRCHGSSLILPNAVEIWDVWCTATNGWISAVLLLSLNCPSCLSFSNKFRFHGLFVSRLTALCMRTLFPSHFFRRRPETTAGIVTLIALDAFDPTGVTSCIQCEFFFTPRARADAPSFQCRIEIELPQNA